MIITFESLNGALLMEVIKTLLLRLKHFPYTKRYYYPAWKRSCSPFGCI